MPPPSFDPYRTLGVPRTATTLEIARARRRLAKRLHPDLGGTEAAATEMRAVNRAWHILSDSARRTAWDRAATPPTHAAASWPAERRSATWTEWTRDAPPAGSRPRERAAAPASVRDSGWLALAIAGLLVIGVLGAGWLAATQSAMTLEEAIAEQGVDPSAAVQLDRNTVIAATWDEDSVGDIIGRLSLLRFRRIGEGWDMVAATSTAVTAAPAVAVLTGRTVTEWPTLVFGYAPDGVARVELVQEGAVGGAVVGGTWAIGLGADRVATSEVGWRLLAPDGSVVSEGRGPLHCLGC
jgi:curved DNA-binding protein CbpA